MSSFFYTHIHTNCEQEKTKTYHNKLRINKFFCFYCCSIEICRSFFSFLLDLHGVEIDPLNNCFKLFQAADEALSCARIIDGP